MAKPIPIISDIARTAGDMGEKIPVKPIADYHRGLKEGSSPQSER